MNTTQLTPSQVEAINNEVLKLSKFKGLNGIVYPYLIECIDLSECDLKPAENMQELLQQVFNEFKSEKLAHHDNWLKYYGSLYNAFYDWLQGLPSCYNIDYESYKILQLAEQWGQIKPNLTPKQREKREDFILNNWFNFVTVKTFQLFNKYNVNATV